MKKTTRRIARTTAALAAALALAAPMTVQPVAEIGAIIAYAAAPSPADLINDIAAHPENFFEVSSTKNEDGCYTITKFTKPAKYQNVKLTTLTIPAKIGSKTITRLQGKPSKYADPVIRDDHVTQIIVSNGITVLGYDVIINCPQLKTITLPGSVKELWSGCIQHCDSLTKINGSSTLRKVESGFMVSCPNMKDTWSETAAYMMLKANADIMTIKGKPIIQDNGASSKPVIKPLLESALRSNYGYLDNTQVLDTYLRIYSRYLLKNTIGITNSMTFNQKVRKIYDYVIPRVSYDTDAWHYETVNNQIVGFHSDNTQLPASRGAIFFSDKAICEGYAKGLSYLFREAGITSYLVDEDDQVLYADGMYHKVGHMFNLLSYNNMFFIVDATCEDRGYLMNITEEKVGHNVENPFNWTIKTPEGTRVLLDFTNIKYALGDVNGNGRLDDQDTTIMTEYINASSYSQKVYIAARYNLTKAKMDCLCDVNCNGLLESGMDPFAQRSLQIRFKFK